MIKSVSVQNFRKHTKHKVDFVGNKTIITGPNGCGKTSLIEAIYVGLVGKSWRSDFRDITKNKHSWWRVDIELNNQKQRTIKYQNNNPTFNIDGKKYNRLPTKLKKTVILFEPSNLNLIYQSPGGRRDYTDKLISSLNIEYYKTLRRYSRLLQQRNNLLKQNPSRNDLFVWDIQLADLAANIISTRHDFIKQINKYLPKEYQKIDGSKNRLKIGYTYYCDDINKTRQDILGELHSNYSKEKTIGCTSVGPHQHDFVFYLNNNTATTTLSRGENRSAILALKNTEYLLKKDQNPIILLDDVLSEFDEKHQINLLSNFSDSQIIITSVNSPTTVKKFNIINLS